MIMVQKLVANKTNNERMLIVIIRKLFIIDKLFTLVGTIDKSLTVTNDHVSSKST